MPYPRGKVNRDARLTGDAAVGSDEREPPSNEAGPILEVQDPSLRSHCRVACEARVPVSFCGGVWHSGDAAVGSDEREPPSNEAGPILEVQDPSLLLLHEDVGESYDAVTRSAAAAVGAESCQLALYDEDTGELIARRPRYDAPGQRVPQYRFRLDSSPASVLVLRTGEPYLSNDPATDPLYDPSVKARGVRSVLTVPVRRGARLL